MSALAEKQSSPSLFDIIDPPLVDLGTQSELFSGIYTPQAELGQPKDAVAVVQEDAEWAQDKMLEAWAKHANSEGGTARARLKIDLPDGSE